MSGYILRGGQENITLPAAAAESLLKRGDGDAALLYLALQRFGRGVTPEELEQMDSTEGETDEGMEKLGEVYYDAETGKYYIIENGN